MTNTRLSFSLYQSITAAGSHISHHTAEECICRKRQAPSASLKIKHSLIARAGVDGADMPPPGAGLV